MRTLISIIIISLIMMFLIWLFLNAIDKEVKYQDDRTKAWTDEFGEVK